MHPIFLEATGLLVPLGLLAANFCFGAWVWDAAADPASETHIRWESNDAKAGRVGLGRHVESSFVALDVGGRHRFL